MARHTVTVQTPPYRYTIPVQLWCTNKAMGMWSLGSQEPGNKWEGYASAAHMATYPGALVYGSNPPPRHDAIPTVHHPLIGTGHRHAFPVCPGRPHRRTRTTLGEQTTMSTRPTQSQTTMNTLLNEYNKRDIASRHCLVAQPS